jgi:hypothetical protein
MAKTPRGKWHCPGCNLKAPKKKFKRPSLQWRIKEDDDEVRTGLVELLPAASGTTPTRSGTGPTTTNNSPTPDSPEVDAPDDTPPEESQEMPAAEGKEESVGPATPEAAPSNLKSKKKTSRSSRAEKDLSVCHTLLSELGGHDESWPFLQPVNTKQFPTYKKIIKTPMDISTIRKKLNDGMYKLRDEFREDVNLMFRNCEIFNEDDSPVGKSGHNMRVFFDQRWSELIV